MPRLFPKLLALVAGGATAVVVGCGGSSKLIPSGDANRLKDRLADVRSAIQAGNCMEAQTAVTRAQASVNRLEPGVDSRLKARIRQGLNALADRVPTACQAAQAQTETIQTVTESTTATETSPATTTTTTPTTTETTPTTTITTPTDTTGTPTTTTPPQSGGTPSGDQGTLP